MLNMVTTTTEKTTFNVSTKIADLAASDIESNKYLLEWPETILDHEFESKIVVAPPEESLELDCSIEVPESEDDTVYTKQFFR